MAAQPSDTEINNFYEFSGSTMSRTEVTARLKVRLPFELDLGWQLTEAGQQ